MKLKRIFIVTLLSITLSPFVQAQSDFSLALQASLKNNPAVKGQQSEIKAKDFLVDAAKAEWLPTVSAEINNVADGYDQGILRIDQPVWTFGKIETGIEQAESGKNAENLALLQVQRDLIEKTSLAYSKIISLNRQAKVAEKNIKEHEELIKHINRRFKGQLASEADVTLGDSRLLLAKSDYQRLKGDYEKALTELKALTIEAVSSSEPVSPAEISLPSPADILQDALNKSADVLYKKSLEEEARIRIESERVSGLPDVMLRGEHDFLDDPITGGDDSRIGFVVTGSLEGLGKITAGRTDSARARYQATLEDTRLTKTEIQKLVDALLTDQKVTAELISSQKLAVEAVYKTLQSYFRLYKSGHKSWIDVLNIQRELTSERQRLVQLKATEEQVRMRLLSLTGGLDRLAGL